MCMARWHPSRGCSVAMPTGCLLLLSSSLLGLVSLEHSHRLLNLGLERLARLQHVQQLGVVDLEQHASDSSREVGVHVLDEREEALPEHLFLLLWGRCSQHGCRQRLLALDVHGLQIESTRNMLQFVHWTSIPYNVMDRLTTSIRAHLAPPDSEKTIAEVENEKAGRLSCPDAGPQSMQNLRANLLIKMNYLYHYTSYE